MRPGTGQDLISMARALSAPEKSTGTGKIPACLCFQSIDKVDTLPSKVCKQTFDGNINLL